MGDFSQLRLYFPWVLVWKSQRKRIQEVDGTANKS